MSINLAVYDQPFYFILKQIWEKGDNVAPRGQKTRELRDYSYILPPRVRFMRFAHRKLKLDYIKQEILWYLRGDPGDIGILQLAKIWEGMINEDGTINSNYGYYLFSPMAVPLYSQHKSNFARIVSELIRDPLSRRAAVAIMNNDHLNSETRDYPCTCYLNFHIRQNTLYMYVRMRSQDAIFGMGNDAPFFSFVHELVWATLKHHYRDLELGTYHHTSDSLHIYERHFEMTQAILDDPTVNNPAAFEVPPMTADSDIFLELKDLTCLSQLPLALLGEGITAGKLSAGQPFCDWLMRRDNLTTLLAGSYRR